MPGSLVKLNPVLRNLYTGTIKGVSEKVTIFCMEYIEGMTIINYLEQIIIQLHH